MTMDPVTILGLVSRIIQSRQKRQVPADSPSAADVVLPLLDVVDQAQQKRIEALEARVKALEAAFAKLAQELESE